MQYELIVGTAVAPSAGFDTASRLETLCDENGNVLAHIRTCGRRRLMWLADIATFTWSDADRRVMASAEPGVSQAAIREAFETFVVPLLLYFAGHEVLHASAVRSVTGVIGFCAHAGTGKSTLAYALSTRGFLLWADDALALDLSHRPRALFLPFAARLLPRTARFFETSSFPRALDRPGDGEAAPLAALAVLKRVNRGDDAVRIERLTGGRAFDQIVRHAYRLGLKTDRGRRKTLIENYMRIVEATPVFEIGFTPGFRRFPSVVDAVATWLGGGLGEAA